MVDPQVLNYIRNARSSGMSDDQISAALRSNSFPDQIIKEALAQASAPAAPVMPDLPANPDAQQAQGAAQPQQSYGYFKKLFGIYIHPLTILEELKPEPGLRPSFMFALLSIILSAAMYSMLSIGAHFTLGGAIPAFAASTPTFTGIVFGVSVVFSVMLLFVSSGIFHLLVLIFGGHQPFYQTFKALAYMYGFSYVLLILTFVSELVPFAWFPLVYVVLFLWILVLVSSAMKAYTELAGWKLWIIWFIYFALSGVAVMLLMPVLLGVLILLSL